MKVLKQINKGRTDLITHENFEKPEGMTDEEWICRLHSVTKHRKHKNITVHIVDHIHVPEGVIEKVLAEEAIKQNQSK